jgi:hypothetical protein
VLVAAVLVTLSAMIDLPTSRSAGAAEAPADLQGEGLAALNAFWGAAVEGTPQAIEPLLAPEFQIERADGSGVDKAAYLKSDLTKFAGMPEFTKLNVSGAGDLLVVRYLVTVNSTRGGKTVKGHAPRLTVFRRDGEKWLVVAHANFAPIEE